MPLHLHVGLQRKVGQPNYGSLAASCQLELELDGCRLERHPEELQDQIVEAFATCRAAVHDELMRQEIANRPSVPGSDNGRAPHRNGRRSAAMPMATPAQVRALAAIASRNAWDLLTELHGRFGVARAEELTRVEASQCIQQFNEAAERLHQE